MIVWLTVISHKKGAMSCLITGAATGNLSKAGKQ